MSVYGGHSNASTITDSTFNKKSLFHQNSIIIIIIIVRKGRQCKAGRERLTAYQSEDPNPTTPTHRMKEEKGKTVGDKK